MFSEFHIVRLTNAIRKIYGFEHYNLVNLKFIQKSFLRYFSTFGRVTKKSGKERPRYTLHVSKASEFVGNSCNYFF